jgi:benzoylformate decarboxylase
MLLLEPWLTNVESTMLPRPWVKWSYEPARAEDVPAAFMRAYATALQPPAGPVFLSIPLDDWDTPSSHTAVVRAVSTRFAPDPRRIEQFADLLARASDPVLILGGAVARGQGWSAATALAEKLDIHVWAAPACERAPFPEDHPLYLGGLPFAIGPLCNKLEGHDLALVIGAPVFRYYPYVPGEYLPHGLKLLHVSDDPSETSRAPVGDGLLADAVLTMEALVALVARRPAGKRVARRPELHRMAPHPPSQVVQRSARGALTAAQVFAALSEVRPDDAVLVEETPSNLPELHKSWPITKPDSFFTFASGGLGWSLPASVGIALWSVSTSSLW